MERFPDLSVPRLGRGGYITVGVGASGSHGRKARGTHAGPASRKSGQSMGALLPNRVSWYAVSYTFTGFTGAGAAVTGHSGIPGGCARCV